MLLVAAVDVAASVIAAIEAFVVVAVVVVVVIGVDRGVVVVAAEDCFLPMVVSCLPFWFLSNFGILGFHGKCSSP